MDREFELYVERKVAEAKLEVAEKRLSHLQWIGGAALVIFGLIIPFYLTNQSAEKVERTVQEMRAEADKEFQHSSERLDKRIAELETESKRKAEDQEKVLVTLRGLTKDAVEEARSEVNNLVKAANQKPELVCTYEGKPLDGCVVEVTRGAFGEWKHNAFVIRNTGTGPAQGVRLRLYVDLPQGQVSSSWTEQLSTDPRYKRMFESFIVNPTGNFQPTIEAQQDHSFVLDIENDDEKPIPSGKYPALLQVFFGQPKPVEHRFAYQFMEHKQ